MKKISVLIFCFFIFSQFRSQTTIELSDKKQIIDYDIQVYNMLGEEIRHELLGNNSIQLNSNISGIYLLRITSENDQEIITSRITLN